MIRRATELQFGGVEGPAGERLPEEEVLRIGREVGLAPQHVRRAIGELRAEALFPPGETSGIGLRLLGPRRVVASRAVPGRRSEVVRHLEAYLKAGESLRQVRKRAGRSRWEAEEGVVARLQRGFRWGGRSYDLARTASLELTVEGLEEGVVLVVMEADIAPLRTRRALGWSTGLGLGGAGFGLGVGLAVASPFLAIPAAVAGTATGIAAARRDHSGTADRIRRAMEGILDRLEAGEPLFVPPPSLRDRWA